MSRTLYISFFQKLFALSILLQLTGCMAVAATTAVGTSMVLRQDRSAGEIVDDLSIRTRIRNRFLQTDVNNLLAKINVQVNEGRVLLTGVVKEREHRMKAVEISWAERGVIEVINEIEVDRPTDKETLKSFFRDNWIVAQVRGKLIMTRGVKSINYSLESVRQVVYVFGIADSEEELQRVLDLAASVAGVEKVVNYTRIKSDSERGYAAYKTPQTNNGIGKKGVGKGGNYPGGYTPRYAEPQYVSKEVVDFGDSTDIIPSSAANEVQGEDDDVLFIDEIRN